VAGERLTGSDKRALVLWVLAGVIGTLFAYKYYFQAFPEASVNFQISRAEVQQRAKDFIAELGENVSGYQSSIAFDVDENAKTYLERELGVQQANQLMSSTLNLWHWNVRFFRPLQEEEFRVWVSPSGRVTGYEHKVEEARAGAALERSNAEQIATAFARAELHEDLGAWELLPEEANSTKRAKRTDWSFAWEKRGFRAKDAPYQLAVTVLGDRVGGASQHLKVPEEWARGFTRMRSGNDTLALAFSVPYLMVLALAVWLGIRLSKQGQTTWRPAIVLGLVVTGTMFLQGLNSWPLWASGYNTNSSYGNFLALHIAGALGFALVNALTITLVLPGAEPLYRESQPERLQLYKVFTLRGLRSKEFFSASIVGLSLAAVHIGYVVGFYVIASRLGAWAPQELNYEESVNTLFPWISGAAIGLLASTNEEFTFRLFAIPFLKRLTGSRWIAVIVPAFLWSFLHSNYPQEPAYIRGIEIGILGVIAGVVMLRWGILATLIWHYTVDAALVGLFLIRSHSLYFKVSGAVVAAAAVAPLAFAAVSYLLRGHFEAEEDLLNCAEKKPEISLQLGASRQTAAALGRYEALRPAMIGFLALSVIGGGFAAWRLKPETIGDYLKLSVNAKTAEVKADEILRTRGVDPSPYRRVTVFLILTDPITNEFLRENIGVAHTNEVYASEAPAAVWQTRYFRDSQPEEYSVKLAPDGQFLAFSHKLAEEARGASLSKEEAIARAEAYLQGTNPGANFPWRLVQAESDKRPHRVDHELTWQFFVPVDHRWSDEKVSKYNDLSDRAFVRLRLAVIGDEVTEYRASYYRKPEERQEAEAQEGGSLWKFVKIPAEWRRKRQEATLVRTLLNLGIPILVAGGLGMTALIVFLRNLRSETARAIPWRRLAGWASWSLAAFVVVFALGDRWATALNEYNTAIPLKTMMGVLGILGILGAPLAFGIALLVFGLAWYFAVRAFGSERLSGWTGMPSTYYRDALAIGLGGAAGLLGLETALQVASQHWPTAHRTAEAAFGGDFGARVPAAAILGMALQHSLVLTGLIVLVASFIASAVRPKWLRCLTFLLGVVSLVSGNWGDAKDFGKQFVAQLIFLALVVFGVRRIMRFNILGCFLTLITMALVSGASDLLRQPDQFYRANGYGLVAVLTALLLWPLFAWLRGSSPRLAGPPGS
jgi:membrane protease YdiL (CAAX protease family)